MQKAITNLSLKRRIWIAIAMVSFIPVIVLTYYLFGYYISFWATLVLLLLVFLGWRVIFEVFSSIVRVYAQSKSTLEDIGEEAPEISDEVQSLETVINLLSDKVRTGFEELRSFTQKTEELNREVTKKVLILSAILQANDLFSKDAPAEEIIRFLGEHLRKLLEANICFCCLKEGVDGGLKTIFALGLSDQIMNDFVSQRNTDLPRQMGLVIIDLSNKAKAYQSWLQELGMTNMVIVPIIAKGRTVGMVGAGNDQVGYSFTKDELEVLNLFSQNVTLIWEHARLSSKIEELEILDHLTDLYNEKMITRRLEEEIKRASAYQRPCGLIAVEIKGYDNYQKEQGMIEAETLLKKLGHAFKKTLRPIDIAGRIGPKILGAILIESNKRCSCEVAKKVEASLKEITKDKVALSFSVAESPLDGTSAKELLNFVKSGSAE
ncbi:MAG: diguanylate cyclase [Candidatus Omnitrophica bacterium]|nr:diguanylate cyclase [Candidatus Omnitrophota bacterium]MBU2251745.1 diguanylate cyclase [Candidatus Omnitrophota bacterium]MBU2265594.1 diguanylate cyclase [Candidatus Omnitrophota bacterium]